MKNRKNKLGSFVALGRPLLRSLAFTSLCSSAKIAYAYFLYDKKNAHNEFGGGGGNRTPVRKVSIEGVYMFIL